MAWQDADWIIHGDVTQFEVEQEELCRQQTNLTVIFNERFQTWLSCMQHCAKQQEARVPLVRNKEVQQKLIKTGVEIAFEPGKKDAVRSGLASAAFWLAMSDSREEGEWRDHYTGEQLNLLDAVGGSGKLDDTDTMNCGVMVLRWAGWQDWWCEVPPNHVIQCVCQPQNSSEIYLTVRGLCPSSNIDQNWVPRNKEEDGQTVYYGIRRTLVEYDTSALLWRLSTVGTTDGMNTSAVSSTSKFSFLLGRSEWRISEDNANCNKGAPYTATLKLTGCREGEFTCWDGQCITMEQLCDTVENCRDGSDEKDCSLVREGSFIICIPPSRSPSLWTYLA